MGRWLFAAVAGLFVVNMLTDRVGILAHLASVGTIAFFFQGVALVHGLAAHFAQGNARWLTGFYVVLLITFPYSLTAVSAAGFADGWFDFRGRLRRGSNVPGD